jgi:hypothetical protein
MYIRRDVMSPSRYTYHSRKRQGFRRDVIVGPKDVYQMRNVKNLKPADVDKVEHLVERNGCRVSFERIEKDCNGMGNIIAWINKGAFDNWHRKNDRLYDDWIRGTYSPTTDETHNSINIRIHSSHLPFESEVYDTMYYASAMDAYDDEYRSTLHSSSQPNLGQRLLENQEELGKFGFLIYVYHAKKRTQRDQKQTILNTKGTERIIPESKRNRRRCNRMTYSQPGEPNLTK